MIHLYDYMIKNVKQKKENRYVNTQKELIEKEF